MSRHRQARDSDQTLDTFDADRSNDVLPGYSLWAVERVFDGIKRTDTPPAKHGESNFAFLNRVAGPFWDRTRATVEAWFSRFPVSEQRTDLLARLREDDDRQFDAAFWELYLHESLLREGFTLTPHPELTWTTSHPDFLVEGYDAGFYLEATVTGGPASQTASERRLNTIYDALDRLDSPNFILWLRVDEEGKASPSTRRLRQVLARWLSGLDPDEVAALHRADGRRPLPEYDWEAQGWRIVFTAFPKKEEARGKTGGRAVGAWGPGRAFYVDDIGQVRRDLEDKSGKYGTPDLPLVIAVAVESSFYEGRYTMSCALFGSEAVRFDPATQAAQRMRRPDGLWQGPNGRPRNTRVAAVIAARKPQPWNVTEPEPVTWLNPWAMHPLPLVLPWESVALAIDLSEGRFVTTEAKRRAHEVLGLPEGWPRPEDVLGE